jgi:alpha-L-fucosidase 2
MKNRLILKTPASWWGARWREALPSGNGTIGAAVYGAVHNETVLLTHEDLWHGVKTSELPDVSNELPSVRQLLFEGRAELADGIIARALEEKGYEPDIGVPLPLGDLRIRIPVEKGFRRYRRELNMETGEVAVRWEDSGVRYERKLFVSRIDDAVVVEITADDGCLNAEVSLGLHDEADALRGFSGRSELPGGVEVQSDKGWIRYAACNDDGHDFGAVARLVENESRMLVMVKVFLSENRETAWTRLQDELAGLPADYAALLAPHAAAHGELFGRMTLDLGAAEEERSLCNEELLMAAYQGEAPRALIEKMWSYGRYLLITSSREGGQPCPLLGKWCGEYAGFWAFNMANENLQMIYWQALSGNMPETLMPVFDYYDRLIDDFRENARKIYGCRGIYVPAVSTPPSGLLKTVYPHIIHWTGAAAWIGQHYYDYYLYSGDETFLRERALPFLRETALFYEDFFIVGEDGYYVSAPSNSPENNPAEYWNGEGMGQQMETTINATMDFALAREVLTHLIEGSERLGIGDGVDHWRSMLEKIPPYQINEDGAVREWMHPFFSDNYHHRHQSHIYPVFRKRLEIGISEQTGWSLAHMANVYARMEDGDSALECLDLLSRSCVKNNFYTVHNDWRGMGIGLEMEWAPFQIDANMGWTAAVQEMLLFSVPGRIKILPALPAGWTRGSVNGLRARGGVQVSIEWNRNKVLVRLISAMDQAVELSAAGGDWKTVDLTADTERTIQIKE